MGETSDSRRAWTAALEALGFVFDVDDGALTWRGHVAGEPVVLTLEIVGEAGVIQLGTHGPPPRRGAFVALPKGALPDTRVAVETGDSALDAVLAIAPRDPWALARLDAQTRAAMVALAPLGLVVTPGAVRLRPAAAERWGDTDAITRTVRGLGELSARLRAPLADPARVLRSLAASDPDDGVRARLEALLEDPAHRAAEATWSAKLDEIPVDDTGFERLRQLALGSESEATRVEALLQLLRRFGERGLEAATTFPGPTLERIDDAVLAAMSPEIGEPLLRRLEVHPGFGGVVRRWALANTRRGRDLGALGDAAVAPDPLLREVAISQLLSRFPLADAGPVVLTSPGPFTENHLRAALESAEAPERRSAPLPDAVAAEVLLHLVERVHDRARPRPALHRALGRTTDPRAVPLLEAAATLAAATPSDAAATWVALWSCGTPFDRLLKLAPAMRAYDQTLALVQEVLFTRPPRGGALLRGLLDESFRHAADLSPSIDEQRHAVIDAMVALGDPEALPALRRGVSETWTSLKMMDALAELGVREDIERLDPLTRGFFRDADIKERARMAIARIQERLGLDDRGGGLSLVAPSGGGLALSDPEEG